MEKIFLIVITLAKLVNTAQFPLNSNARLLNSSPIDPETKWDSTWDFFQSSNHDIFTTWNQLNLYCSADDQFVTVSCYGIPSIQDLPSLRREFLNVRNFLLSNVTNPTLTLALQDIYSLFPNLESISLIWSSKVTQKFLLDIWTQYGTSSVQAVTSSSWENLSTTQGTTSSNNNNPYFIWPTVRKLDLGGNDLSSKHFPFTLFKVFPNLSVLNLRKNNITTIYNLPEMSLGHLKFIDLSENPLDCTSSELEWVDHPTLTLINVENTFCEKPPHQLKPKPILQTLRLIKKVKSECRLNCTCAIDYIWEQDKVIYYKTAVNCSNRGFHDFPDPENLPKPTDTLYLNSNEIESIEKFARMYDDVGIRNLYLENNTISSINFLEATDWIDSFHVLSLRNNRLTDIPIHMLENIIRENQGLHLIDLSLNNWKCNCRTVSTFKVWLLRHPKVVKNIEDVRCDRTKDQIRYLDSEDWCKQDEVSAMIELLDIFSIFLGTCIILVILKVSYDYWRFKRYGKVPWLVRKM